MTEELRIIAQDNSISFEARGMLFYILSVDGVCLGYNQLKNASGETDIYAVLDELMETKYAGIVSRAVSRGEHKE